MSLISISAIYENRLIKLSDQGFASMLDKHMTKNLNNSWAFAHDVLRTDKRVFTHYYVPCVEFLRITPEDLTGTWVVGFRLADPAVNIRDGQLVGPFTGPLVAPPVWIVHALFNMIESWSFTHLHELLAASRTAEVSSAARAKQIKQSLDRLSCVA